MSDESKNEHIADAESINAGYELHDVSVPAIVAFTIFCLSIIVASIFALDGYFIYSKEKMLNKKNNYVYTDLAELRANEHEKLSSYAVIDKSKGIYRIPVNRAMELLANESFAEQRRKSLQK